MTKRPTALALVRDQRGATAIEYGLIVSLIVIAIIVALTVFAQANSDMWASVENQIVKTD